MIVSTPMLMDQFCKYSDPVSVLKAVNSLSEVFCVNGRYLTFKGNVSAEYIPCQSSQGTFLDKCKKQLL